MAILACILTLIFYKYTVFFLSQMLNLFKPEFAENFLDQVNHNLLPAVPPLAISFFCFEFVHYLVEIQRGKKPIRSPIEFSIFAIFWPSVVSGPIKRFDQFLDTLKRDFQKVNLEDVQAGILRIVNGLIKKIIFADNLTAYINFHQPHFSLLTLQERWLLVLAISLRILFDFSGYSDMAIGLARLMGIKLPENFRWPYLATSLQDFWQRWHISLSTWIRDYIYIPLGGNKNGNIRKMLNGMTAFAVCGLWHGAAWNFMVWGIYHGIGLVIFNNVKLFFSSFSFFKNKAFIILPIGWMATFLFVSIGWLFFFYPIQETTNMILLLLRK